MKAAAPGKIILSGEHAVVYGKPALALAVDRFATVTITAETLPGIVFDFEALNHRSHVNAALLKILKSQIKEKYQRFRRGDFSIRHVLKKPFELAQFAFGTVTETFNLALPHGIKIHIASNIPMGCGMGSSAATIVSVMYAISQYLQKPLMDDELFKLALEAENMQHGASSGIDLRVALHGGCLFFHGQRIQQNEIPRFPLYIVNTGTPMSSTGECVAHAATFLKSTALLNEFEAVTMAATHAIEVHSQADFANAIRVNHDLLVRLGVVPLQTQRFVQALNEHHAAAKICGAGSVMGENAGMVLVVAADVAAMQKVCHQFDYTIMPLTPQARGVHAI